MSNAKILVVEDSIVARKVAVITFEKLGCIVNSVEDGFSALNIVEHNMYDLILMDIGLPDISGIEVTKKIRATENNEHRIFIVALTANFSENEKHILIDAGLDDLLIKPLPPVMAKDMLNKYTGHKFNE